MARIFELLFVAFLLYLAYRRIAAPIQRGFDERERERKASQQQQSTSSHPKLDRSSARDAAFKDLP
jgi:hypothetical protein